jgi:excisionase family DNA binding protein
MESFYVEQTKHKVQQYYKPSQVWEMLNIHRNTFYSWVENGVIEVVRINGNIRVPYSSLVDLIDG